jgi:hypothetical protein
MVRQATKVRMRRVHLAVVAMVVTALAMAAGPSLFSASAAPGDTVTVGSATHVLTGTNVTRTTDALVLYTPDSGARTGTNQYGFEATVVNGKVTAIADGVGNAVIPSNGAVLSGHGESRSWLKANAVVGATVVLPGSDPTTPPTSTTTSSTSTTTGTGAPTSAGSVKVGSQVHAVNGTNIYRASNFLVLYTAAVGASTGANQYGTEVAVVNNKVTAVQKSVGDMAIPAGGVVLSGHGTSATWLNTYATVGAAVVWDPSGPTTTTTTTTATTPPSGTQQLPDLHMRTLRNFTVQTVNGVKELKFPGVTSNIGNGPFDFTGTRSSSTSTDWSITQKIFRSGGGADFVASPGVTLYFAGDGHNHWHVKDLDKYELLNSAGSVIQVGEKHGFCFEDNTSYMNWPGSHAGSPANPVYTPPDACGVNQPNATSVHHGVSVGWGDTYPATLPDQYIDITGVPNGSYRVQVTADWADWFKEVSGSNNTSWADITISGTTVTIVRTGGGT